MPYFDALEAADTSLLHADVRQHPELAIVALRAEQDVLSYFAGESGAPALTGYATEPATAAGYDADRTRWTGLCLALRLTIADVVSHRLRYYDDDATLQSVSRGSRSQTRFPGALDARWPPRWHWRLRPYDARLISWSP